MKRLAAAFERKAGSPFLNCFAVSLQINTFILIGKDARRFDRVIRLFPARYSTMFNNISKRLIKKASTKQK